MEMMYKYSNSAALRVSAHVFAPVAMGALDLGLRQQVLNFFPFLGNDCSCIIDLTDTRGLISQNSNQQNLIQRKPFGYTLQI